MRVRASGLPLSQASMSGEVDGGVGKVVSKSRGKRTMAAIMLAGDPVGDASGRLP